MCTLESEAAPLFWVLFPTSGKSCCFVLIVLGDSTCFHLLASPSKDKLLRVLKYLLDEDEFLSPYGIRSLSKVGSIATVMITIVGRQYSDHVFV